MASLKKRIHLVEEFHQNKGYRFYVDKLLNDKDLNIDEIRYINSKLKSKVDEMEELTKIATNTISEVTHYTTVAIGPNAGNKQSMKLNLFC